jgi:hypothetical protein
MRAISERFIEVTSSNIIDAEPRDDIHLRSTIHRRRLASGKVMDGHDNHDTISDGRLYEFDISVLDWSITYG